MANLLLMFVKGKGLHFMAETGWRKFELIGELSQLTAPFESVVVPGCLMGMEQGMSDSF